MYYGGGNMIGYIKREDAHDVAKMQKTMLAIIIGGMAIVYGIMGIFVLPKLGEIGVTTPKSIIWVPILLIASLVFVLTHQYDFTRIDSVVKKHSRGEMIKIGLLWDYKYDFYGFGVIILSMAYIVYTVILPIYNLTSSI